MLVMIFVFKIDKIGLKCFKILYQLTIYVCYFFKNWLYKRLNNILWLKIKNTTQHIKFFLKFFSKYIRLINLCSLSKGNYEAKWCYYKIKYAPFKRNKRKTSLFYF